jgi:hypothetical protein
LVATRGKAGILANQKKNLLNITQQVKDPETSRKRWKDQFSISSESNNKTL